MRLAIPRLKKEDLQAHLNTIYALRTTLPHIDNIAFLESDFEVHNLILSSGDNVRRVRLLATLHKQVALFQIRDTWYSQRIEIALSNHERLLMALLKVRNEQAIGLLSKYIQNSMVGVLVGMYPERRGQKLAFIQ